MLRYTGIFIAMLIVGTICAASATGLTIIQQKGSSAPGLFGSGQITYTVTYNGNGSTGGTVPVDSSSPYAGGAKVTALGNTGSLVKTLCTFNGWNTSPDGSGTVYRPNDTFTMGTANVTLYAQWKQIIVQVGNPNIWINGNNFKMPALVTLLSLSPGNTITFAGYTWIVLDPSTGYLLMQSPFGSQNPTFDHQSDPNWSNKSFIATFDPNNTYNIAYYLNNPNASGGFYSSLSPADQALIQSTSWTTGNEIKESLSSVACNVGLLSYSEYNTYQSLVGVKANCIWWLRTPVSKDTGGIWAVGAGGGLNDYAAYFSDLYYPLYCRPAIHLDPGDYISGGNGGIVINAPTVTGVFPSSGPLAGGTQVTITGINLTGAEAVEFGSKAASFASNSSSQISAISPQGTSAGAADVTVTTPIGTSAKNSADQFTYLPATPAVSLQLTAAGGNGSVTLNWTSPSYGKTVTGFYLYRGTSADKESSNPLTDFPVTGNSYTDQTAQNGTTYYYILKPVFNDNSQGAASNEASATPAAGGTIILQVGNPDMTVNGVSQPIDQYGTVPVNNDGRVCLPISAVIQAMGGTVAWNQASQQVTITLNGTTIILTINSTTAQVNGQNQTMNVAPYISSTGRTMVPLSFVTDSLGCTTNWDGANQSVTINFT
jgi:uncharacterized repeat protein (TIGR02543 family)